ncbi:MAG TPA: malate synthase A [Thermoplasmata archaeon]|nr:malate synthase A [Thermoplasmata archaeon]
MTTPASARAHADVPDLPIAAEILSADAIEFLAHLHARFDDRRRELLTARSRFRAALTAGRPPAYPVETEGLRASEWKVAPPPEEIRDRRVEITGPVDRKMVVNALNSGASVYMADFEDAHSPVWSQTVAGQANLVDAIRRRIDFATPDGREYRLGPRTAVLMMRPRGWHLEERHVTSGGRPLSASLVDFGLYIHHNARELVARGSRPYVYLPKIEHAEEARLWDDVLDEAEQTYGLPTGTIRATVLIETLPAAFEMDEILYALRAHSAGLNCGRWDYLFSCIKQYRDAPTVLFPDRRRLTMSTPFLAAYSHRLIQVCHRRGAHAMGGMAAQIPIRDDPAANAAALALVVADKEREARAGHDGTWVAHPGLVPVAREVFDRFMPGPNQIDSASGSPEVDARELTVLPSGPITEDGIRRNARVSVRYLDAWLRGTGCVPIDHLMEDAATVEISRSQLWQWVHHGAQLEDGRAVDMDLVRRWIRTESEELLAEPGGAAHRDTVRAGSELLDRVVAAGSLEEFITVEAYRILEAPAGGRT